MWVWEGKGGKGAAGQRPHTPPPERSSPAAWFFGRLLPCRHTVINSEPSTSQGTEYPATRWGPGWVRIRDRTKKPGQGPPASTRYCTALHLRCSCAVVVGSFFLVVLLSSGSAGVPWPARVARWASWLAGLIWCCTMGMITRNSAWPTIRRVRTGEWQSRPLWAGGFLPSKPSLPRPHGAILFPSIGWNVDSGRVDRSHKKRGACAMTR